MNAKRAKLLRKKANKLTRGKPEVLYARDETTHAIKLLPGCKRYTYHMLKKHEGVKHG